MDLIRYGYNGRLLTIIQDDKGNPWWVAKEVCDELGLTNVTVALEGLDADDKTELKESLSSGGRRPLIINEPGLYSLIFKSRKPEAKAFKHWVTHEVLPSIRKTGYYHLDKSEEKEAGAKQQQGRPRKSDSGYGDILKRQRQLSLIFDHSFRLAKRMTQSNKDAAEIAKAKVEELTGIDLTEYLNLPPGKKSQTEIDEEIISGFVKDCCLVDEKGRTPATELYQAFTNWFEHNRSGDVPRQKWFGSRFGLRFRRKKDGIYKYIGVGLKPAIVTDEGYVRDFIEECCSLGTGFNVSLQVLFERFNEFYLRRTGQVPLPRTRFTEVLSGYFSLVPDGQNILAGIRLLPVAKAEA